MLDGVKVLLHAVTGGEFGEDRETPHTVLVDALRGGLRRYGTPEQITVAREAGHRPVLLVPPLAVPARAYDLSPDQSVVAEILAMGRIPYVVDLGDVGPADRNVGFEDYFDRHIPEAIARIVGDDAHDCDSLDLMAWSIGGTMCFLTAAANPVLPIRSITAIGTPLDYSAISPYPIVRTLMRPVGAEPVRLMLKALGGVPAPVVRAAYRATAWQREIKKPAYIMSNAGNETALARMKVIDRFQESLPGYPGRVTEQMWTNFIFGDELASGVVDFDGRIIDITRIAVPIALFGSHRDAIVPWAAAHHGLDLFTASPRVDFTTVEASHLGLIAGREAAEHTWPAVARFLHEVDSRHS